MDTRLTLSQAHGAIAGVGDADMTGAVSFDLPVPCVECQSRAGVRFTNANGHVIHACLCGNVQSVYLPATESEEVSDDD